MFNAPAENVFTASSNVGLLKKWWGPKDFSNTINEFDMRPVDIWRYVMHGPNGIDYENSEFIEINYNEQVVFVILSQIINFYWKSPSKNQK